MLIPNPDQHGTGQVADMNQVDRMDSKVHRNGEAQCRPGSRKPQVCVLSVNKAATVFS
ncbi:hypothetical protein DPMN_168331 [Dreissena polymorpha]|uniref:Uncharacterized protein n=1 Tax=Dreissena polymorpha TaxID=45954 RepID=A0A9D4F4X7_DREPO|nr:hypothetical protein DPMN_168331 [Dreissena polymorpha]